MPETDIQLAIRREQARARYAANPDKYRARTAAQKLKINLSVEARAARREWRKQHKRKLRAANLARGLTAKGTESRRDPAAAERKQSRQAERDARITFRTFIKFLASDEYVSNHYASCGSPWNNPRLSAVERFRLRYALDADYHSSEFERLQKLKKHRRGLMKARSDGTLKSKVLRRLFDEARECPYCFVALTDNNKSLDHIVALERGGAHSITNVQICCRSCNSRKQALPLAVFLARIAEARRGIVPRVLE